MGAKRIITKGFLQRTENRTFNISVLEEADRGRGRGAEVCPGGRLGQTEIRREEIAGCLGEPAGRGGFPAARDIGLVRIRNSTEHPRHHTLRNLEPGNPCSERSIMYIDLNKVNIYIRTGYTDMRKQINTLAILVRQECGKDPLDGSLYVFCGSGRRTLKVLYWEKNGFCLWMKRLNDDKFPWPLKEVEVRQITREQMQMILSGIDFFCAHSEKRYNILA